MLTFSSRTFKLFLGQPTLRTNHRWGTEERYTIPKASLEGNRNLLSNTLYQHHSSMDISDEMHKLGFPFVSSALRKRSSGNPSNRTVQMGNLGEVLGAEFSKWILGYESTRVLPKRFNLNLNQPMPGPDILGWRDSNYDPTLLIGESKCLHHFNRAVIEDALQHLSNLHKQPTDWLLRPFQEMLKLTFPIIPSPERSNLDRHTLESTPRSYLIFVVSQSKPEDPFSSLEKDEKIAILHSLRAVHIQLEDLYNHLSMLFDPTSTS